MNPDALRYRQFWYLLRYASERPGEAAPILADWLDDHDSPIKADLIRRGVPQHNVEDRGAEAIHRRDPRDGIPQMTPEGYRAELPSTARTGAPGVILPDEGKTVRLLHGNTSPLPGAHDEPLAALRTPAEDYELFATSALHQPNSRRFVIRHTHRHASRRALTLVTSVTPEQLRTFGNAVEGGEPFVQVADRLGSFEDKPTKLARVQALAGGQINNSMFQKGGQFMARTFKSIKSVAAKLRGTPEPTKLARPTLDESAKAKVLRYLARYPNRGGFYRLLDTLGIEPDFSGPGMTKDELRLIEKTVGVTGDSRLTKHPEVKKLKGHQRIGAAGLDTARVYQFLSDVQRGQHDPKILALATDKKLSPEVRAVLHAAILSDENRLFIGHLGDPRNAGAHWYTAAMNPLDVAYHSLLAEQPHDPNWGSVDWRHPEGPRLRYNGAPAWEHAPHQVLAKAVTAFLSGNRDPEDNAVVASKMLKLAQKRQKDGGHPTWVDAIPFHQHDDLERWLTQTGASHPGTADWDALVRYVEQPHVAKANKQGGAGMRGFQSAGLHAVKQGDTWHAVGLDPVGGGEPKFFSPEDKALHEAATEKKKFTVPLVDAAGQLQPKKWSTMESVDTNIRDLQRVLKHNGGDMKAAAKWLLTTHPPEELARVLNDRSIDGKELYHEKEPTKYRDREVNLGYLAGKDSVPGSWLFGPKFGPFFQNIHGNTPVPTGEAPDYYTRWDTQDVHRTRGHKYRTGETKLDKDGAIKNEQPGEGDRLPMFFAATAARDEATPTESAVQSVDWKATKSLPSLFGVPVGHKDFVHGANEILRRAGKDHLLMHEDGTLVKPVLDRAPRKPGLSQRADLDTSKLSRRQRLEFAADLYYHLKLMRAPDPTTHDALLRAARDSHDPTALGVLADHLEESEMPGAQAARKSMHYGLGANHVGFPTWQEPGWRAPMNHMVPETFFPAITEAGTVAPPEAVPLGQMEVRFRAHYTTKFGPPTTPVGTLVFTHAQTSPAFLGGHLQYEVPVTSMEQVHEVTGDLPEAQRDALHAQVGRYLPATADFSHPVLTQRAQEDIHAG